MSSEYEKTAKEKMVNAIAALRKNLARISTGRPNPAMLDSLKIQAYGSDMRIDQLATVTVEDRTLVISAWDNSTMPAIERAIVKSNLGLNPSTTDTVIRLNIPPLSEEMRMIYTKQAKEEAESAKISIRNARRDANSAIKTARKATELSENEANGLQQAIDTLTQEHVGIVDDIFNKKHTELMTV